jgi:hypothetical protein
MTSTKHILFLILICVSTITYAQKPSPKLLDGTNHTLVMIDHQPQMAFATQSHPIELIRNNAAMVSKVHGDHRCFPK